jgi:hypothetical protein
MLTANSKNFEKNSPNRRATTAKYSNPVAACVCWILTVLQIIAVKTIGTNTPKMTLGQKKIPC